MTAAPLALAADADWAGYLRLAKGLLWSGRADLTHFLAPVVMLAPFSFAIGSAMLCALLAACGSMAWCGGNRYSLTDTRSLWRCWVFGANVGLHSLPRAGSHKTPLGNSGACGPAVTAPDHRKNRFDLLERADFAKVMQVCPTGGTLPKTAGTA